MTQSDADLFKLTTLIFDAALGNHYYQEFAVDAEQIGIDALAHSWGASDIAKSIMGATPAAQARALTMNLGLDPDSTDQSSGDYIAHDFFLSNLNAGMNVGSLALAAIRYLEQDDILPVLETTRTYLNNRAEVAYQYSVEFGMGGEAVDSLQSVIEEVTSDEATIATVLREFTEDVFDDIRVISNPMPGTGNDDNIVGTDGSDYIDVGAGYDTVNAGKGADIILGGTGDDKLYGERGQDMIEGGDGADTIYAGAYYDSVYVEGKYDNSGKWISSYYTYTVDAYFEVLNGGSGADKIYGGYGSDTIDGGDGADTIYGEENTYGTTAFESADSSVMFHDRIFGGEGDDQIYAGYGSDTVYGGAGNDNIRLNYSSSSKSAFDGQNTAYGEDGNDTIYSVGNDNVDGGSGDDSIRLYRTDDSSDHAVIIAGEGADKIYVDDYSNNTASMVTLDLQEETQVEDRIYVTIPDRATAIVEILNFDLDTDLLDLQAYFHIYSADGSVNRTTGNAQDINYKGEITKNYVQIVQSTATPWQEYTYPADNSPDAYGKAYFVIQGAKASSSSTADVAALIDSYGNNAVYGKSDSHIFMVNVNDKDVGIYKFTDDTGANNRVVSDELTPIALLTGITTADITYGNVDFLV